MPIFSVFMPTGENFDIQQIQNEVWTFIARGVNVKRKKGRDIVYTYIHTYLHAIQLILRTNIQANISLVPLIVLGPGIRPLALRSGNYTAARRWETLWHLPISAKRTFIISRIGKHRTALLPWCLSGMSPLLPTLPAPHAAHFWSKRLSSPVLSHYAD